MPLPYDYYPAVLHALNLLSQGDTLTASCDKSNLPLSTFHSYVNRDATLHEMYVEAELRGGDAMAEALINIDNHRVHGHSDPQMAKIISDNIKWFLGKRRAKDYGDRVQVDHSISVDLAITTALDAARRRVPAEEVIDAEVLDDIPMSDEALMLELLS